MDHSHVDLDLDPQNGNIRRLTDGIFSEAEALKSLLAELVPLQTVASPHPVSADDVAERRSSNVFTDETATIALDARRAELSAQVLRSVKLLRSALLALRGVRRGLEMERDGYLGM